MQKTKPVQDVSGRDVPIQDVSTRDVPIHDVPLERLYGGVRAYADIFVSATLFVLTLMVYLKTLAPSVAYMFDDSLEFQLLAARMAIAHPTGYPLYSILIKLATFLPIGEVAYRVNLVSALSGAGAVAFLYLAARLITNRFLSAKNPVGETLVRAPALISALLFAFGEIFWSQSILAEVYAPQAFLTAVMLWLALRWGARQTACPEIGEGSNVKLPALNVIKGQTSLVTLSFFAGLMLTHHRMSILIFPALAVYVLSYDHSFLREPRTLLKMLLAFALPLLLYLYLPIRGTVTSSLDGAYQNTPEGFLNWMLGTAYTVFVTENPLSQTRDAGYYAMRLVGAFTPLGLLAACGGFVALFLRAWREWMLLTLAVAANLAFVLTYRVADIDVFFIPTFLFGALLLCAGLAGLLWLAYYALSNRVATIVSAAGALLLLLMPLALFQANYPRVDLSDKYDVIEYGRAIFLEPLADNATIVGILGEMSLLRYLQETERWDPQLETIAADKEAERFNAIQDALNRGRTVYLTRPLAGIEKKYSLTSLGALAQVQPAPKRNDAKRKPLQDFGGVELMRYVAQLHTPNARSGHLDPRSFVRVDLDWQPQQKINNARFVSLKLLDAAGKRAGQIDRQPVLDAYPTTSWRKGEDIIDSYMVPVFVGAAPGEYILQLTMYDPASGQVYGQRELERVNVLASTRNVPSENLGVSEIVLRELGGMQFAGYDLDTSEPYAPGAGIPVTLLWRLPQNGMTREIELTLTDQFGKVIASQSAQVGSQDIQAGQYMRQELGIVLPETLAAGKYPIQVNVRGGGNLPFTANGMTLGIVEVAGQ